MCCYMTEIGSYCCIRLVFSIRLIALPLDFDYLLSASEYLLTYSRIYSVESLHF